MGRRLLQFVKKHYLWTAWIVLLLIIVEQFAFLPYLSINDLKTTNPGETAFMKEAREKAEDEGRPFKLVHSWVPLRSIPRNAQNAIIIAEDGTFWQNEGFDWYEFRESMEKDWEEGKAVRDASTMTQQLVKNLYLSSSKNPLRKVKEWVLTWYINRTLSKQRILELYLNEIEWGDGIYGIDAAARTWFHRPASSLTREECARLAGVIPSPLRHRPNADSKYVLRRATMILRRMDARGW